MLAEASEQMKPWGAFERLDQNSFLLKRDSRGEADDARGRRQIARESKTWSVTLNCYFPGERICHAARLSSLSAVA